MSSGSSQTMRRDVGMSSRCDGGRTLTDVRLGIADHLGSAVAVTASTDHLVVDRRRIDLVEPGVSPAPIHYESGRLDVAATAALLADVRAPAVRATSAALDEIAAAVRAPIAWISLRIALAACVAAQHDRAPYDDG